MTQHSPIGELLTSEEQYRAEIALYTRLTPEQEQYLIACARTGDRQACEALLIYLLPNVEIIARRYYYRYSWQWKRLEFLDLVQEGNRAIAERFDVALEKACPCSYLIATAEGAIHHYCYWNRSSIHTPQTTGAAPIQVESLEALCSPNDDIEVTLLDLLAAPSDTTSVGERDYTPLYQAVETLSKRQRTVITRLYGLYDTASEKLCEVQHALNGNRRKSTAKTHKYRALQALRHKLAAPSDCYRDGGAA